MPSDSNTPVTQAHLPATQAEECDAAGYTKSMRELLDSLGGYQNVFNAIADATSVYAEGVGVNIGVRAFIRSITPHSQSRSLPGDVGTDAIKKLVYRAYCAGFNDRPGDQFWNDREADFDAAIAALTPSPCPGDVGMRKALTAMCAAQKVEPYSGWNLTELNAATDRARELLGLPSIRDLNPAIAEMQDKATANRDSIRSLLGHAALTPSALSGDAGEGETSHG